LNDKSENILLDKEGNIKITDFGFAIEASPNDQLSDLLGTPGYLAPELLKRSVESDYPGYNKEIDVLVSNYYNFLI
jgi:serine/threonine protein kinase